MNNIDLMNYWIESANEDYDTMIYMKAGKKNTWSLFMGHMVIEKLIKALYAKKNKNAPYPPRSHDLLYLAEKAGIKFEEEQEDILDTITSFNINARYDDYKKEFHLKCTDEYTEKQLKNIEEMVTWIKKQLITN